MKPVSYNQVQHKVFNNRISTLTRQSRESMDVLCTTTRYRAWWCSSAQSLPSGHLRYFSENNAIGPKNIFPRYIQKGTPLNQLTGRPLTWNVGHHKSLYCISFIQGYLQRWCAICSMWPLLHKPKAFLAYAAGWAPTLTWIGGEVHLKVWAEGAQGQQPPEWSSCWRNTAPLANPHSLYSLAEVSSTGARFKRSALTARRLWFDSGVSLGSLQVLSVRFLNSLSISVSAKGWVSLCGELLQD